MLDNILKYFTTVVIIASIGFFVATGEVLALGLTVLFVFLRAIEILSESHSNSAVTDRINKAEQLLTDTQRTTDVVKHQIEDAVTKMDRDYDDRLDVFARGLNNILSNINSVTMSLGYGENLKKVNKSQLQNKS